MGKYPLFQMHFESAPGSTCCFNMLTCVGTFDRRQRPNASSCWRTSDSTRGRQKTILPSRSRSESRILHSRSNTDKSIVLFGSSCKVNSSGSKENELQEHRRTCVGRGELSFPYGPSFSRLFPLDVAGGVKSLLLLRLDGFHTHVSCS